uniref:CAF1-p150_C2 domain-containing protein n=1 Tax=Anopheles maculatus TaxID=74869 RepID=A0A182SU92_9DIPT
MPGQSRNLNGLDTSSNIDSSEEDIYLLCTPDSKIVPNDDENKLRKLTPKQLARRQDYEKRRALKQLEKQEKCRKLKEEREEKAREKEEQERQRKKERVEKEDQKRKEREEKEELKRKDREEREEQKRKDREEKEEQKRKEREEKEKKRQAEIEQKNEEKRLKEEERRKKEEQKEEERKRKEEEKEAEEKRKQKVAQAFTSFFVKKSMNGGGGVKASDDENSVESSSGGGTMMSAGISLVLQRFMPFCVKGDMRLAPTKYFNYDVDSDDEWEEEEPGESLHGSDDEKDSDPEEDYEVDNEFFVPHGHLSDEELHAEEENEIGDDNSPESQKLKLQIMQQEFAAEMKKKTEKIKPRLIGCIWEKSLNGDKVDEANRFMECSVCNGSDGAMIEQDAVDTMSPRKELEKPSSKKVKITDDAIRDLARLMHGNVNNRKFLVREFHAFWASRNDSVDFSFESIRNKIKDIAQWGTCRAEGPMEGKLCWTVEKSVLQQYDLMNLTLPNDWKYHLQKRPSTVKQEKKTDTMEERSTNVKKHNSYTRKIDAYVEEEDL